jgi:hypothetical protein
VPIAILWILLVFNGERKQISYIELGPGRPKPWRGALNREPDAPRIRHQPNIDNVFGTRYTPASLSDLVIVPGTPTNSRLSVTHKFFRRVLPISRS